VWFGRGDAWVAKYKVGPNGATQVLWKKQLGTSTFDYSDGVATDSQGNILISGSTYGVLAGSNKGENDAWVAKYSPEGTLLWTKQLGTSDTDSSSGVATDSQGNVFISGTTGGALAGSNIALRVHIRTVFEGSIYTITEVLKLLPALLHPVFEHKPPTLNLVKVWRVDR
jgi:hypothetical protein